MRVPVGQVADLLTGITPRQSEGAPTRALTLRLLSLSDVSQSGEVLSSAPRWGEPSSAYQRYAVHAGDILFRGRGGGFAAALVPDLGTEAAAVAPLVIVRPGPEVEPAYLAWALNSPEAHEHYAANARGSALPAIGATDLSKLMIPLPPRDVQMRVAEVADLARRESALLQELSRLRTLQIDNILQLAANQTAPSNKRAFEAPESRP